MNNMEWRDIPGFEGRYQASDDGQVRSVARRHECGGKGTRRINSVVKKPRLLSNGYQYVMIWVYFDDEWHYKKFYIHRLVALAFLPNPDGKPIVNHKDRNRANNDLSNLEWCNNSENVRHWREDERRKQTVAAVVEEEAIDPADIPF